MLHAFSAAYAFACAHGPAIAIFLLAALPTLITGLSSYPRASGFVDFLKVLLNLLSLVSHRDSPGTFKAPLTISKAPDGTNNVVELAPRGFVHVGLLAAVFVVALLASFAAAAAASSPAPAGDTYQPPAHATPNPNATADAIAQDPAAVQPVAEPGPVPSQFGGCVGAKKNICFAPALAITVAALNLRTKTVEGAFDPGLCYGVTINPGKWSSVGADGCFVLSPAAQQASVSALAQFFNGYFRVGWSKGFIGDTAPRILFATGLPLP